MLLSTPLNPTLYPRGTFFAAAGLLTVAFYYHHIWGLLKDRPSSHDPQLPTTSYATQGAPTSHLSPEPVAEFTSSSTHPPAAEIEPTPFVERNYLYGGLAISVLTFLLAASADTPPSPLDRLVGALMGLCGVIFAAMFAYGLLALWYLWKEWIGQLKNVLYLRCLAQSNEANGVSNGSPVRISSGSSVKITSGSFLRAIPVAVLWLIAGFALFLVIGVLLLKPLEKLRDLYQHLMLAVLTVMFYSLWKSRTHAALVLRFILLFLFSVMILAATLFAVAWSASQTAPLLVTFLAAITTLNTLFYARWVRLRVLINNLE